MQKETKAFQAEVKQILDLMVHSLYSQREIFLRELVSNASDALDRLRYEEIQDPSLNTSQEEKHIRLIPDATANTLTIQDNGIGMRHEEVEKNIGTIAYSGTKNFIEAAKKIKESPALIGQFGVGFYSAFMVADRVELETQRAGETHATRWESNGDGTYTIATIPARQAGVGTSITLHLKKFAEEEEAQNFTDEWTLRSVVRKYSDFIEFPIKMKTTRDIPVKDADGKDIEGKFEKQEQDDTLNSQKALWLRPASEISDAEYQEFYKHISHEWKEPLTRVHYKAEGSQEFSALMYVPSTVPYDYNQRETKYGFSLYVKRVFIMECCQELVPQYLRFMKGVVDSSDLPLNVSREILQKDRTLHSIRKALISKLLRHFKTELEQERGRYESFWKLFGATLKEGIPSDYANKDALVDLLLCRSTHSEGLTTLAEYVARMPSEQKAIYFITGESVGQLAGSPYLEKLKKKGFEVLLFVDPVDEWVTSSLTEYQEKKLESITRENFHLDGEEEEKAERKEKETAFKSILSLLTETLAEKVKEVKVSDRLVDSPVCLVSGEHDPSAHMQRLMEAMGQDAPKAKRTLEINVDHPIFSKMQGFAPDRQKSWAHILYSQALLNEGSPLEDPMLFSKQISELMLETQQ